MPAALTYPHIAKEPDKPARLERQPRTRISMIVRDHQDGGLSAEEIVRQRPTESIAVCFGVGVFVGLLLGLSLHKR